jgi:hypothetical protein
MKAWTVLLLWWRGVARALLAVVLLAVALLGLAQPAMAACGDDGERLCNLFTDGRPNG